MYGLTKAFILGTMVGEVVKEGYHPEWSGHIRVRVTSIRNEEVVTDVLKVNLKGKVVKNCSMYLRDGSEVFVEGELRDSDGIVAQTVRFL